MLTDALGLSAPGHELLEGAPQASPADLPALRRQMPVGRKTIGADEGGGTAGRRISAEGQALLIPEIEVQTWWINLAAPPEAQH